MSQEYIDWDLARRTGHRIVKDGPKVTLDEARAAVAELHSAADRAHQPVADTAALHAPAGDTPVHVVDRTAWIDANTASMGALVAPAVEKITAKKAAGPTVRKVGAKVTGAEMGALLGYVASKVLGQFDLAPEGTPSLLLVAPNVVQVERELGVDPSDFRLWVCLHEETHRVQFTAVPWMREHLFGEIRALTESVEPQRLTEDLVRTVSEVARGARSGRSLPELMGTPEQREIIDRVTGMMSLLEGHADVVMDEVGPTVIPSVARIRARFNERRKGIGPLDRVLRRLLGLDAKMAQYRDGARFVRAVVDKAGMAEFNTVWESPANLPSKEEIADPDAWMGRVLR